MLRNTSHLVDGSAKVLAGESGEAIGTEALDPRFRPQQQPHRRIRAGFTNRPPKGKPLLRVEEHARLIHIPLRKSCSAQDLRGTDSQVFQFDKIAAGQAKVLIHSLHSTFALIAVLAPLSRDQWSLRRVHADRDDGWS